MGPELPAGPGPPKASGLLPVTRLNVYWAVEVVKINVAFAILISEFCAPNATSNHKLQNIVPSGATRGGVGGGLIAAAAAPNWTFVTEIGLLKSGVPKS